MRPGPHPAYAVDLDLLEAAIDALGRCEASCDDALRQVSRRVAELQVSWSGESALAQEGTQADWEDGFARIRAGLADMRRAARTALGNYRSAADTNVRMWGSL